MNGSQVKNTNLLIYYENVGYKVDVCYIHLFIAKQKKLKSKICIKFRYCKQSRLCHPRKQNQNEPSKMIEMSFFAECSKKYYFDPAHPPKVSLKPTSFQCHLQN